MPAELHWLAVGVFATILTLGWIYRPDERLTTTAMLSTGAWAWMALTAQSLTRYTETGETIDVAAGSLAYFPAFLAVLSMLALILYRFGHYPPREDDPAEVDIQ